MGAKTGISWTDATWNPIRGCSRVSAGCMHCYAETMARRFNKPGEAYAGLTTKGKWNGTIRVVEEHLADPLRWQKPRRIFVNSMSDLFHVMVADETIDRIFARMALAKRHVFQVLTKRPEQMRAYLSKPGVTDRWREQMRRLPGYVGTAPGTPTIVNVHLGVSVEDQATADERIPLLLQTPAAVRFVSYEPALGPVDFTWTAWRCPECSSAMASSAMEDDLCHCAGSMGPTKFHGVDWIIVGGESGPGARPFDVAWARSTIAQCKAAGVACFVKQLGARPRGECGWQHHSKYKAEWLDDDLTLPSVSGRPATDLVHSLGDEAWPCYPKTIHHRAGADPMEWPEDLRVQEFPR